MGNAFKEKGQLDNAMTYYQKVLLLTPNCAEASNNLGNVFKEKGQFDEAITYYQKALQFNPNLTIAYKNLGVTYHEKGQFDEAMNCYQKALRLDPTNINTYHILGMAYQEKGQLDEAINCYQKALQLNSNIVETYNNLGNAYQEKGQLDDAMPCYQKALQLNPDLAEVHWNMSRILLLSGNFKQGWKEFEWRWKKKDFISWQRNFFQPLWDGDDIAGLTILLHAEQGTGDKIQFVRYAPLVAQRGAKVIVECQKELTTLLKNIEGVQEIIVYGEQLPEFDVHCPLLSLPLVFDTTLESIPAKIPYIAVDFMLLKKWRDKVQHDNSKLKIGLVWAGRPEHKNDQNRSCPLDLFSPLAQLDHITFYSLQKGEAAEQAKNPPRGMKFIDHTDEIHDFLDAAALIENLDLIISVDTAVAHLAGALGKPVWTLLPFSPDWRWMLNREDSPWYPTMRLFRQSLRGDWDSMIESVLSELQKKVIECKK